MRPETSIPDANRCATRFVAPVRFRTAATSEGGGGTSADPGERLRAADTEMLITLASLLAVANRRRVLARRWILQQLQFGGLRVCGEQDGACRREGHRNACHRIPPHIVLGAFDSIVTNDSTPSRRSREFTDFDSGHLISVTHRDDIPANLLAEGANRWRLLAEWGAAPACMSRKHASGGLGRHRPAQLRGSVRKGW